MPRSNVTTRRYTARARAKVNLALEVIRKRRDGFHEIETILQSIDLCDRLDIEINRTGKVITTCTDPEIPTDERNLCNRAVNAMRIHAGGDLGALIHLEKHIPPSAGLGGGSSDAAAVILAVDRGAALGLSREALEAAAARVGSDVPFMLYGGTMFARGRGEVLTPLTTLRQGVFLIVKPPVDISTAWAYKNLNFQLTRHRYRFNLKAVNAILARFPDVALSFRNAFEDVVCPSYPLVYEVLEELLASKPRFASMSGSGSAVFAIYESEAQASQLAGRFSIRGFFTAVAKPSPRAVDLNPAEVV
ncbi:MAG: 4-(cytidine 5'-diphospho)-2-C-methyl-D-erythritol kinase [Candidatus Latescibacterota bacterium]|nr:MAG: 4-(cytidine 5'-diphospho)-2-C-methyl-D-erythritol kinase [Candidatus Latescibacterota bacterium]